MQITEIDQPIKQTENTRFISFISYLKNWNLQIWHQRGAEEFVLRK